MSIVPKLLSAFNKIGNSNGTAPPSSQDTVDAALHELFVADTLASVAKKRKDAALSSVKTYFREGEVEETVEFSRKNSIKNSKQLLSSEHYSLTLDTKAPANKFDQAKLRTELRLKGWTEQEVDDIMNKCTDKAKPAETYTVTRNG